ncbi:UNVERIFIED_CONTAM: hypothetical protein HDU68_000910 [Siphonaria sp. JEL0065]|nr:hypothetical protein HDU68_000910 [Siphonaria sp. JEL0065]
MFSKNTTFGVTAAVAAIALSVAVFIRRRGTKKNKEKETIHLTFEPTRSRTIETIGAKYSVFEYGAPAVSAKHVVLYLHGIPGSRLVPVPDLAQLCLDSSVLLISPDRLGFGQSTRYPSTQGPSSTNITDFNAFAQELFRTLDAETNRFISYSVVGYSLGAPLALGLITSLPPDSIRVSNLHIIAPVGFTSTLGSLKGVVAANRFGHWIVRNASWFLKPFWRIMAPLVTNGDDYILAMIDGTGKADREALTELDILGWNRKIRDNTPSTATSPPIDVGARFVLDWLMFLEKLDHNQQHPAQDTNDVLFGLLASDPSIVATIGEGEAEKIRSRFFAKVENEALNTPELQLFEDLLVHPSIKGDGPDAEGVLYLSENDFFNWGATVLRHQKVVFFPQSVKSVQEIVLWSNQHNLRVRCAGYRHSWANIFSDNEQILISFVKPQNLGPPTIHELRNPENDLHVIQEAFEYGQGVHKVGPAVTNEMLRQYCIDGGKWSMPFNVIMTEITFGGSNAPICHGAGTTSKTLSDLVVAMEIINVHGKIMLITDPVELTAASGCFGILGPVVSLYLKLVPMEVALMDPKVLPREQIVPRKHEGPEWDAFVENIGKYYCEFFVFPHQSRGWLNCWNKTPLLPDEDVSELTDFPSFWVAEAQNIQTYLAELSRRTVFKALPGKLQGQIIGATTLLVLPHKPVRTYLHDALHFTRGINNLKVNDMEFECRIPESNKAAGTPDYTICSSLFWVAVDIAESMSGGPVRIAVEMRVTGPSDVILAPQRGNKFGTCSIEILQLAETNPEEKALWKQVKQRVFDAWLQVAKEYGVENGLLPHFAKDWSDLKVDGVEYETYLREQLFKDRIVEFRNIVDKIGADRGFTVEQTVDKFSNDYLRSFIIGEKGKEREE